MNNTVSVNKIEGILRRAEIKVETIFDKCTVVTAKLANGFIITESSACVDVANYDVDLGSHICIERIKNKLWELEGYKLQCEVSENA